VVVLACSTVLLVKQRLVVPTQRLVIPTQAGDAHQFPVLYCTVLYCTVLPCLLQPGAPEPLVLRPEMYHGSFKSPAKSLQFNRGDLVACGGCYHCASSRE
jgi:hypothetical protein